MIGLLCFVLAVLTSPFKSRLRLEAENAALRHQLMVLRRRLQGRIRLTNHDRWFPYSAVSLVSINLVSPYHRPARDARALAQGRFSLLLALEVAIFRRPTADRHRAARVDPADQHRQSTLGRAAHPRRNAQARL